MHEIIIAGFGGQGVLTAGQILAYAGMSEGKQVSWFPSYGPEQRGGTANCSVVVSPKPVSSPVVQRPTSCIVMNQPSLDKFESWVRPGGVLVVNTSLVSRPVGRSDIQVVPVAATDEAIALGNPKVANMVALGALLGATGAVEAGSLEKALRKVLGPGKERLVPLNMKALQRGMELAAQVPSHL